MSDPSPAALKAYAAELRELAAAQRRRAATCEGLLAAVVTLDTAETWSGTYPDQAHGQFRSWVSGLGATATALRADATGWLRLAEDYDSRAAVK